MRIAWLMPGLHRGGGVRMAVELSRELTIRGHEVTFLVAGKRVGYPVPPDIKVVKCGWDFNSPLVSVLGSLLPIMFKIPPVDLIIASMYPLTAWSRVIGYFKDLPSLFFVMGDEVHLFDDHHHIPNPLLVSLYRRLTVFSYHRAHIVVNSHWTATRIVSVGGPPPIGVIPGGVSPQFLAPHPKSSSLQEPPHIVSVGRLSPAKGLNDLVKALNILVSNGRNVRLTLISPDVTALESAQFPYEIINSQDDGQLVEAYRGGDIFVNPSWREGFGLPVLEAMACGLPIITTDCGGIREFVRHRINGWVVPVRDPLTMAKAIDLLLGSPQLRSQLARAGWETAHQFTWERSGGIFHRLLKEKFP
ncbi:MAG: glycosyltransferase family 4 protein [bacterium]